MRANVPAQSIKLHRYLLSGHSHRVELFLSLLELPYALMEVNLKTGAQKHPQFLAMNPFGQVPVIQDGDIIVGDSNAILVYLATRYGHDSWLPRDPFAAAAVQRWLSVAAGPLASGPAAARRAAINNIPVPPEAVERSQSLFSVMDSELKNRSFLVGSIPTIADIANYTYSAHAEEGGISLAPYPRLRNWLRRIEALPGFIPMTRSNNGLAV
ncbi:MAG TPA: glutathione S-transferase family protein [Burkholderiales bacterium]|nr:glutathione S-transferase family protein [Burkholderiales bacterium]